MVIHELLKKLRSQSGKTQFQLATESGVSLPTIQKIESGKANPGLMVVEAILNCLHYRLDYKPMEPNWDLLSAYGVPLSSAAPKKSALKVSTLLSHLQSSLSYYDTCAPASSREWEALAAFLLGLKTHFSDFYDRLGSSKELAENLISQQSAKRLYKLRRIAISAQARYL